MTSWWGLIKCWLGWHGRKEIVSVTPFVGTIRCMRCGDDLRDV